ncbi:hypothetical protein J2T08_005787 [Neorhizobium galegae]|nr:hypothetical protein [Neorhizobium galegae]MDQ0137843.1 hypothetical protein [Neorhizobium galegae]
MALCLVLDQRCLDGLDDPQVGVVPIKPVDWLEVDFLEVLFSERFGERVVVDKLAVDAPPVGPVRRRGKLQNDPVRELRLEFPPRLGGNVVCFVDEKVADNLRHPHLNFSACLGDRVHRRDDDVDPPEDVVDLFDRLGYFFEGRN